MEQPGGLKASGHAPFLDQAKPVIDHVVVLRAIYPRVLMADGLIPADRGEHFTRELSPVVRSEAFEGVPDVGLECRRCHGHTDRTVAPEGVDPSLARRVILEQSSTEPPLAKAIFVGRQGRQKPAAGLGSKRRSNRRHRRTPTVRLHAPTAGKQGPRQLDVMLSSCLV